MTNVLTKNIAGREMKVESGRVGMLSDAAIFMSYGDTVILTNVNASEKPREGIDFFPLSVEYEERLYSVGKIPGGFIKREGRPSENAILFGRAVDRPLRPLFPKGYRNDVQVVCTVVSVEQDNLPEILAINAASMALSISSIPFTTPVAAVQIGLIDGNYVLNPTSKEREESILQLTVCATKDRVMMIEAGGDEIPEDVMIGAIEYGFEKCQEIVAFQEEAMAKFGKKKDEPVLYKPSEELAKDIQEFAGEMIKEAMWITDKDERNAAMDVVNDKIAEEFTEKYPDNLADIKEIVYNMQKEVVRDMLLNHKRRPDGRAFDEIRKISCEVDLLPRTHGTGLFTRGLTQVMTVATLGAVGDIQIIDGIGEAESKRYMHHYNFPAYSVGEVKPLRGPGRREIGHGALGERALLQVMPSEDEFPYTVRVVSEVLESNGSSSQATICAGCMSLMTAGVPIKAPVAGIAMGLITKGDKYTILTDIQGMEDHLGDMDFKVAGTRNGICALQMDIKIKGITKEILKEALAQAKQARFEVLDVMEKQIATPRKEVSKYAPKTMTFMINPNKIKDVIGKGGEMITKIICDASNVSAVTDMNAVKVDLEDDGRVIIYHTDKEIIEKTANMIKDIVKEVETGKIYTGKVVKVEDFGCFVELWPGCEGLVHVSHLANERVEKPSDVVKVGDDIIVKSLGIDKKVRLNLSRKEAMK